MFQTLKINAVRAHTRIRTRPKRRMRTPCAWNFSRLTNGGSEQKARARVSFRSRRTAPCWREGSRNFWSSARNNDTFVRANPRVQRACIRNGIIINCTARLIDASATRVSVQIKGYVISCRVIGSGDLGVWLKEKNTCKNF